MVDLHVSTWYAQAQYWNPQGKTAAWPDRVLLDQGAFVDGADVLNLGCFYPEDEEQLAHRARSWVAIDFVEAVVARCRAHRIWSSSVRFECADMRQLPFPPDSFTLVTDFSSGDHLLLEDWHRVLVEVSRVLRPGGHFLVCFANREAFIEQFGETWHEQPARIGEYGYVRADTPDEMQAMLESHGFTVVARLHCNAAQLRAGMLVVLAEKP
jgi:SAM-dependent methyltransferase